jgi:hypothetical protein
MQGRLMSGGSLGFAFSILLLGACAGTRGDAERPAQATAVADSARPWRRPGDKIDSILPMPEYLRRFRVGLRAPSRFEGGAKDRTALAREFLAGVSRRDTAALSALLVSRAEFAWLVFPDHLYARPPYELDPEIFWMQLRVETAKGFARTLQRLGGQPLALRELRCTRDTLQLKVGATRVWSPCSMQFRAGDSVITRRLFGSIVERDGRAKLLSFASEF